MSLVGLPILTVKELAGHLKASPVDGGNGRLAEPRRCPLPKATVPRSV